MKKKKLLLIIPAAAAALVLLVVLGLNAYVRLGAGEYYAASRSAFPIPGIGDGVIGQALCYDGENDAFLAAGYMKDGSASRLYLIGRQSGKIQKTLLLADEQGAPLAAHCACMALIGPWLYITGEKACGAYVFEKSAVTASPDGGTLKCAGRFAPAILSEAELQADIVCVCGEDLVIGEFYHSSDSYPTPTSHHLTAPDGSARHALCFLFPLNDGAAFGADETPRAAWSIPDNVQGIEISGSDAYLSTSWAVTLSRCEKYDLERLAAGEALSIGGQELPLSFFDASSLVKSAVLPPMSEQMALVEGEIHTMCEAASSKYLFGRLYGAGNCLATDTEKLFGRR